MLRRKLKGQIETSAPNQRAPEPSVVALPSCNHQTLGTDGTRRALEKAVFGDDTDFNESLQKQSKADEDDSVSSSDEGPSEERIQRVERTVARQEASQPKVAWVDEDDDVEVPVSQHSRKLAKITSFGRDPIKDGRQFNKKLRAHFEESTKPPKWAETASAAKRRRKNFSEDESEDEEDLLRRTGSYIGKSTSLPKQTLQFKRLCDVTASHKIKATINTTEFHRQARVLLVSGYTQRLMLFQIDAHENQLLHSVQLDRFPIETARFSADGERILVGSSMHQHFFVYDMHADKVTKVPRIRRLNNQSMGRFVVSPDGRLLAFNGPYGSIHLLSANTCDYISTLKMNGSLQATCFSANGDLLYSHGGDGHVYVWDTHRRQCVHRFYDDGCVTGTSLAVSRDDRYVACGSNSGVVNIYSVSEAASCASPRPVNSLMNLTTPVTKCLFSPTGEMLLTCSSDKENAVRLYHSLSRTTFENFPYKSERLSKINAADFSPNSGYLCCGNDNGQAFLYRLRHYHDY